MTVTLQDLYQRIVWQSLDVVPLVAGHVASGDQRVDDRLLDRLDSSGKKRADLIVWHRPMAQQTVIDTQGVVGRRKGDEDVARAVAGNRADASEAERRA